jgi:hypothetical protein
MMKLVWRNPLGRFVIKNDQGAYVTDPGYPWNQDVEKAVRFATAQDAQHIADNLCAAGAVMGGYCVVNPDDSPRLTVVELT